MTFITYISITFARMKMMIRPAARRLGAAAAHGPGANMLSHSMIDHPLHKVHPEALSMAQPKQLVKNKMKRRVAPDRISDVFRGR